MANLMAKTRPADQPYLTVEDPRIPGWTTKVLKANVKNPDQPYASAFCLVTSPMTGPAGDMGDTYWADIEGRIVQRDPIVTDDMLPSHLKGGPKIARGFDL